MINPQCCYKFNSLHFPTLKIPKMHALNNLQLNPNFYPQFLNLKCYYSNFKIKNSLVYETPSLYGAENCGRKLTPVWVNGIA